MNIARLLSVAGLVAGGLVAGGSLGAAPSGATSVPACAPAQITLTRGQSQGTAGTNYTALVFTNHGATCAIWGVPAVQPVTGAAHTPVGPPARKESFGETAVHHVIAKGQSVSDAFGVADTGNFPVASCAARSATGVFVSMGAFVHLRYVALPITVCVKQSSTSTRLVLAGVTGD